MMALIDDESGRGDRGGGEGVGVEEIDEFGDDGGGGSGGGEVHVVRGRAGSSLESSSSGSIFSRGKGRKEDERGRRRTR